MVGIDPQSDVLKRAERLGVSITAGGIDGLVDIPAFRDIEIVFDATSAGAHKYHNEVLLAHGKRVVDLTPAAIGPFTIPPVNVSTAEQKSAIRRRKTRPSCYMPGGVA